jgi:hypothetical protein
LEGAWGLYLEYEGKEVDSFPEGPSFERQDRRIFIADYRRGRTVLDPAAGQVMYGLG